MPCGVYVRTKPGPFNGKHHDEETKERIRRGHLGKHYSTKGGHWTEARKEAQLRVKRKRKKKRKPVIKKGKEYSPDWHDIRREIYKRDNWFCRDCGIKCHNGINIQCHHIDYDIKNNDFSNLITLCGSCHAKTNFRREDWMRYLREKIKGVE